MKVVQALVSEIYGATHSVAMFESVADDVAAYAAPGLAESADYVLAHGFKLTEREALRVGFTIPRGKHYRR